MHEHKCKGKPREYVILVFDGMVDLASLENIYNEDVYIDKIIFCPWCGVKLEDEK